jgi:uroporphyrinogen decarboxylase
MDRDWESGMWQLHGMVNHHPLSDQPRTVLERTDTHVVVRTPLGAVVKQSTRGSSIDQHLVYALEPTPESWRRFTAFLDPSRPGRYAPDWRRKAEELSRREHVATFMAGSLFGWPRGWMGVEHYSILAYTDPALLERILEYLTEYLIALHRPVLERVRFDFAYFFEDCCFSNGPLISPDVYRKHFHKYYRRLIEFYRGMGVPYMLVDSDGRIDHLIPCWLDSGFDIVFPVEVGTWHASPVALRRRFGRQLRMMGGVDKHVIPRGEAAVREHLEQLRPAVEDGGYVPLPDHRIPPDCSLEQFSTYVHVFREMFGPTPAHPAAVGMASPYRATR